MCTDVEVAADGLVAIAGTYRQDEQVDGGVMPLFDRAHVLRWIGQFEETVRLPILEELSHVLSKTYLTRDVVGAWLSDIAVKIQACQKRISLLCVQGGGQSQQQLVAWLNEILMDMGHELCPVNSADSEVYIYLDDIMFSGGRVRFDISRWIEAQAPENASLFTLLYGAHTYGIFNVKRVMERIVQGSAKNIRHAIYCRVMYENRKSETLKSDVLRPKVLPDDAPLQEYVRNDLEGRIQTLRRWDFISRNALFSCGERRHLLEQEFLKKGVYIRSICPNLNAYQRPLGNCTFPDSLGFGSLTVTYRNCPNNAPLVLWAGSPWYPLFPRVVN